MKPMSTEADPLWLRYLQPAKVRTPRLSGIFMARESTTLIIAKKELNRASRAILGRDLPALQQLRPDALVVGTASTLDDTIGKSFNCKLEELGAEGFVIR